MRTRSLILGAIVLVVATAISIFALRALTAPTNDVIDGVALATVVVSTRDIQANRDLTPLIDRGVFMEIEVPVYALVEGAVTDVIQVEGAITTVEILKNEQISTARLTSDCCID